MLHVLCVLAGGVGYAQCVSIMSGAWGVPLGVMQYREVKASQSHEEAATNEDPL